jgi:hypothetical protein
METFEPNVEIDSAIQSGDVDEPILSLLPVADS